MKLSGLINHFQGTLPLYTGAFSARHRVEKYEKTPQGLRLFCPGHGVQAKDKTVLCGLLVKNPVQVLKSNANLVTFATGFAHDLTPGFQTDVVLLGPQGPYTCPLEEVPASNGFTASQADERSTFLLEDRGLNKAYTVLEAEKDSFVVDVCGDWDLYPDFYAETRPRISGSVSFDNVMEVYTSQAQNELWAFVVLEESSANKDLAVAGEGLSEFHGGEAFVQDISTPFSVYVLAPATDSLSARQAQDLMCDIRVALFKCLLGARVDTGFTESESSRVTFVGDAMALFNGAVYAHVFRFDVLGTVSAGDIVPPPYSAALRRFSLTGLNSRRIEIKKDSGEL